MVEVTSESWCDQVDSQTQYLCRPARSPCLPIHSIRAMPIAMNEIAVMGAIRPGDDIRGPTRSLINSRQSQDCGRRIGSSHGTDQHD